MESLLERMVRTRPKVWSDFIDDLKGLKEDDNYKKAISGETQIKCFNEWVKELKENNYLHNHTRMWFVYLDIYFAITVAKRCRVFYETFI